MSYAWFNREEKWKATFTLGGNYTEIDFLFIGIEYWRFCFPGEFQHALVITDIDMKEMRNVVRKTHIEREKISLLNDVKIRK